MRIVGIPKSKGLNGCQEIRGFSEFQDSEIIVNPVTINKYLSQAQLITENQNNLSLIPGAVV